MVPMICQEEARMPIHRNTRSVQDISQRAITSLIIFCLCVQIGFIGSAKAANRRATFAVGIVKPSPPGTQAPAFRLKGCRFEATRATLIDLISFAYGLKRKQIVGAPPWVETDKYDVMAQTDRKHEPTQGQWRYMMQRLLSESFRVKFHRQRMAGLRIGTGVAPSDLLIIDNVEKPNTPF